MKKYENKQVVIKNFKTVLLKYVSDLKINEYYLEKAFNYLIDQITNQNLECVIGLSQIGTKMLREKFGFNSDNIAYTYEEIAKKDNIKNIQVLSRIVFHNLYIVISDIDNILEKDKNEKRPNLSILIGKLFKEEKIIQCFVIRHIYTLGDLLHLSTDDIYQIRGLGSNKAKEIIDVVHAYGFKLRNEISLDFKKTEGKIEENVTNFKQILNEKYFKTKLLNTINQKKYLLGLEFLLKELLNLDKKCILSLTIDETYIIRLFLGFNSLNRCYTYLEIAKLTKIKDIPTIINQIMIKFTMIIDNIYECKQINLQDSYPLNMLVGELNLSPRVNNVLFQNKIYTIANLLEYHEDDLLKIRNLGEKSVLEIVKNLSSYGLNLKGCFQEKEIKKDTENLEEVEKQTIWQIRALVDSYQKVTLEINELTKQRDEIENKIKDLLKDKDIGNLEIFEGKSKG